MTTSTLRPPLCGSAASARRCGLRHRASWRRRPACASALAQLPGLEQLPADSAADLTLFSPSKARAGEKPAVSCLTRLQINLFLRVVRRREDGFHDLASLFHVIDFGDVLEVSRSASTVGDTLCCDAPGVPVDATNLVNRAFDLFRRKTGSTQARAGRVCCVLRSSDDIFSSQRFWTTLRKRVPAGAGLGGGSGNAATALWAANQLCGRPASEADLLAWCGEIGSDISVFFSRGAAFCTGRGEVVREESSPPPLPLSTRLVLVKPPDALLTPAVFKALRLESRSTADPEGLLAELRAAGTAEQATAVNDLEPPAFTLLPSLAELKVKLISSGMYTSVFMSGSGSTIVCVGADEAPPWAAQAGLFVAPGVRLITRKEGEWYAAPQRAAAAAT